MAQTDNPGVDDRYDNLPDFEGHKRVYAPEDPVWLFYTDTSYKGWIETVHKIPFTNAIREKAKYFRMYDVLDENGRTRTKVPSHILYPREV